jgi:hypothetical protein
MKPSLFVAVGRNKASLLRSILTEGTVQTTDLNWRDERHGDLTALHVACSRRFLEIVEILLAQPEINVNLTDNQGRTPLNQVCENPDIEVLMMLLRDPRVDCNLPNNGGQTPLWSASLSGSFSAARCLILCRGSELSLGSSHGHRKIAREKNMFCATFTLLQEFVEDPVETRRQLEVEDKEEGESESSIMS